ncbi:MAG: WbqC family protein [Ghiorsea sp.]
MGKIVTIHQPNYMPWSGFFHKWMHADAFVILDTVQYHKNEWQNRNQIKTSQGSQWVTVPVSYRFPQHIEEVGIVSSPWAKKQVSSIEQAYAKAAYLSEYWPALRAILLQKHTRLVDLNVAVIRYLGQALGCTSPLLLASELPVDQDEPTQRLIAICQHLHADTYLSGQEGRSYLQQDAFSQTKIKLMFQHAQPPTYSQLHGTFVPYLSALDLLLNTGKDASTIIKNMGEILP